MLGKVWFSFFLGGRWTSLIVSRRFSIHWLDFLHASKTARTGLKRQ